MALKFLGKESGAATAIRNKWCVCDKFGLCSGEHQGLARTPDGDGFHSVAALVQASPSVTTKRSVCPCVCMFATSVSTYGSRATRCVHH